MEKRKLNNLEELRKWRKSLGPYSSIGSETLEPSCYPCIVVWKEWSCENSNWDDGCYSFVYLVDFQ